MQVLQTLTNNEWRDIEQTLKSEIARMERTARASDSELAIGDASLQSDARYSALTEALRRLNDGTYGICIHCGNQIPAGRLLVIPETDHCVGCSRAS
jgi:RNA polymerase-binding transcription factor DksA